MDNLKRPESAKTASPNQEKTTESRVSENSVREATLTVSTTKLSFEESLHESVVLKELCSGCAACVLVCPFNCLEYFEEKPSLTKKCEICGICPKVCPRFEFSEALLEKLVFERERQPSEEFGFYGQLAIAQATDNNILQSCQDGGVVSALLTYAFKSAGSRAPLTP